MPLPDHISVSQFKLWTKCPRQHYYRYGEGLIEPPRGAMVIGDCTHSALEYGNKQRAISGRIEPWDTLADVFSTEFKQKAPDAIWDEEPPTVAREKGINALKLYHETVAPAIQPAAVDFVERKMMVPLSPRIKVSMVIDVVDTEGRIIDYKTANKDVRTLPEDTKFQLWVYRAGLHLEAPERKTTQTMAHYLIGGLDPKFRELTAGEPNSSELFWLFRALETTRGAMEHAYASGDFPPAAPGSWVCSPKWCGYWDRCRRDW